MPWPEAARARAPSRALSHGLPRTLGGARDGRWGHSQLSVVAVPWHLADPMGPVFLSAGRGTCQNK